MTTPAPDLTQRLEARAATYERVMGECATERATFEKECAARGEECAPVNEACPTCEESTALIPELREAAAEITSLRAALAEARKVLNPVCDEETVVGAIRNLQQALLSTQGNLETTEQALAESQAELQIITADRDSWRQQSRDHNCRIGKMLEDANPCPTCKAAGFLECHGPHIGGGA